MSSAVLRLPPEILGQIFSALREPIYLLQPDRIVATTLSRVCSQWRETALLHLSLWSWLIFEYFQENGNKQTKAGTRGFVKGRRRSYLVPVTPLWQSHLTFWLLKIMTSHQSSLMYWKLYAT
ncbi:hypothetical protein L218DRAFT_967931 [Marasmius fiardii PR-910]|nr:hypothetical protein L218DRAFT_967931 [Marasmius fiardii PR-910]